MAEPTTPAAADSATVSAFGTGVSDTSSVPADIVSGA